MIAPRWRKVFRDIWSSKTRTALVVLSITIGVTALGMVLGSNQVLTRELDKAYKDTHPASFTLYTGGFYGPLLDSVRRVPGVAAAEGRSAIGLRFQANPGASAGEVIWKDMAVIAQDDYIDSQINLLKLEEGAWPPAKKTIYIERSGLALTGRQVGDTLTVESLNGKPVELLIAGTIHDLSAPSSTFVNQVMAYTTPETLDWLGYGRFYNQILVVVEGDASDEAYVKQVADRVQAKVEKSGLTVGFVNIPRAGQHWFQPFLTPMAMLMSLLGGVSLFLSALLVINTISALLTQHVRQIGVMKAIGAGVGQVTGMYLGMVLVFGLISMAIAVPLGINLAEGMTQFMTQIINFDVEGFRMDPKIIALQAVISLGVPVGAAMIPIRAGTRLTVREAISGQGLGRGRFGTGRIDRLLGKVRGFSRPVLLSLRNTFRRKARLALTLLTLVLASAVFIAVASVYASLMTTLDVALRYFNYELQVNFNRSYRSEQLYRHLEGIPYITAAETWGFANTRIIRMDGTASPNLTMLVPPTDTEMIDPLIIAGRWLLPDDENAVVINSDVLREDPDIQVGDEIVLNIEDRETSWVVVGIARAQMTYPPLVFANYDYFARLTGETGRAFSLYVKTNPNDPASQAQFARDLEARLDAVGLQIGSISTTADLRMGIVNQFNVLILFLVIMAVVLAVVGGLGLMGAMSLNVLERTREIGVMRAIGASDGAVARVVLVEGITIGLISFAAGTLLAVPVSKVLVNVVGMSFIQSSLSFTFSIPGTILWLVVILGISTLASLAPARSATRLTVREVLAYE